MCVVDATARKMSERKLGLMGMLHSSNALIVRSGVLTWEILCVIAKAMM